MDASLRNDAATFEIIGPGKTLKEASKFEWIQHGDTEARRRARSHVTRGFRRQKAEQAKLLTAKFLPSPPASNGKRTVVPTLPILPTNSPAVDNTDGILSLTLERITSTLIVRRVLGTDRLDPFDMLPVKLNQNSCALLDHYLFTLTPVVYAIDGRANFKPMKHLCFNVVMQNAGAIHSLLSGSAYDLAALQGEVESDEALMHKSKAITLVNHDLSKQRIPSLDSIATVCVLSNSELLFGTPQAFKLHMDGLAMMIKLRGGMEAIRKVNPGLFDLICWTDYSGSCNMLGLRRFLPPNIRPSKSTDTYGVPLALLNTTPAGYDLKEWVARTFARFQVISKIMQSDKSAEDQDTEISAFLSRIDDELYRSIFRPDVVGGKGRRQFIEQVSYINALIVASVVTVRGGESYINEFADRLMLLCGNELYEFGSVLCGIDTATLSGISFSKEDEVEILQKLAEATSGLDWLASRTMKIRLLKLFLYDEICQGPLQTLWGRRLGKMPRTICADYDLDVKILDSKS